MTTGSLNDLKRTLTETIVSYSLIVIILFFDFFVNILKVSGAPIFPHEAGMHPISIGAVQIFMVLLVIIPMLARRIDERRYV